MRANFSFHWVNEPFEDSVLYAQQQNAKEDVLFDLGDLNRFSPALMMRVKWVCVSHTHLDHFVGFPRFLRANLKISGREIHFFGPEGFIRNMEGALAAYTWNLLDYYDISFLVTEIREKRLIRARFHSRNKFKRRILSRSRRKNHVIVENDIFKLEADVLNHNTPVLGYRLSEKDRFAVNKDALSKLGFQSGPWLGEVKEKLMSGASKDFLVSTSQGPKTLGELEENLIIYKKFPSYAYLTDFGYNARNVGRALELAREVDKLFIESNFLDRDRANAEETQHLTALQAGMFAQEAGAKEVRLFHFSQRYLDGGKCEAEIFYREMETGREIMRKQLQGARL